MTGHEQQGHHPKERRKTASAKSAGQRLDPPDDSAANRLYPWVCPLAALGLTLLGGAVIGLIAAWIFYALLSPS